MRRTFYILIVLFGIAILFGTAWAYLGAASSGQSAGGSSDVSAVSGDAGVISGGNAAEEAADPGSQSGGTDDYAQSDSGEGGVELSATLLTPGLLEKDSILAEQAAGLQPEKEIGVLVNLNTHSVDLVGYDLVALSSMRTARDEPLAPTRWMAISDDGHHRSGILVFPQQSVDLGKKGDLSLTVKGIAEVPERVLTWQLPLS